MALGENELTTDERCTVGYKNDIKWDDLTVVKEECYNNLKSIKNSLSDAKNKGVEEKIINGISKSIDDICGDIDSNYKQHSTLTGKVDCSNYDTYGKYLTIMSKYMEIKSEISAFNSTVYVDVLNKK